MRQLALIKRRSRCAALKWRDGPCADFHRSLECDAAIVDGAIIAAVALLLEYHL
jgi:hypothetical protein